jgi:hypothetical protein
LSSTDDGRLEEDTDVSRIEMGLEGVDSPIDYGKETSFVSVGEADFEGLIKSEQRPGGFNVTEIPESRISHE